MLIDIFTFAFADFTYITDIEPSLYDSGIYTARI